MKRKLLGLLAGMLVVSACDLTTAPAKPFGLPGFSIYAQNLVYDPILGNFVTLPAFGRLLQGRMNDSFEPHWGEQTSFYGYATWYDATLAVPNGRVPGHWQFLMVDGDCGTNDWNQAENILVHADQGVYTKTCVEASARLNGIPAQVDGG